MDPLQRTPGTAPTAFSQDPPWLRRRERNSLVKNRMREICTSGSVRDGDGNVPIYSALDLAQRCEEGSEGSRLGEGGAVAERREAASLVGSEELAQEQSPKQARKNPYRQKEPRAARHPARVIEGDAAAWDDHVHMRMMRHRRAPAVKHGRDADLGAKPLGIGGDRQRGLSRRGEQQTVDSGFVLVRDIGDRTRQRKREMELAD